MRKSDPRQLIADSGLFKPDSFDWILEIILNNKNASSGAIDLMVRTSGELMSGDEKKQIGLRANAKISKKYFNSLSDRGKEDILGAALSVTQNILHAESIQSQHDQMSKLMTDSKVLYEAELMTPNDDSTCKAALDLEGKRFQFNEVPDLPLSNCDADNCRCVFLYHKK